MAVYQPPGVVGDTLTSINGMVADFLERVQNTPVAATPQPQAPVSPAAVEAGSGSSDAGVRKRDRAKQQQQTHQVHTCK